MHAAFDPATSRLSIPTMWTVAPKGVAVDLQVYLSAILEHHLMGLH